jgi:hypothetical protein
MIWRQAKDHIHTEILAAKFRAEMWNVDDRNYIKYNEEDAPGLLMEYHYALEPQFESPFSSTVSHLTSQSEVNDFSMM